MSSQSVEQSSEFMSDILESIRRAQAAREEAERANPALAAEREAGERRRIVDAASTALRDHGVPARVVRQIADGQLKETSAVRKVRMFHATPGLWCMVLGGSFGIGKSMAAALWLWLTAEADAKAKRTTPFRAPECWKSAAELARIGNYDRQAFDEVARMPALVIDDLGAEFADGKGAFLAFLGDLLNERQGHERRTLITTNLTGNEFVSRYGIRIMDRIREGGIFEGIVGPNMRVSTAEQLHLVEPRPHPTEVEPREGQFTLRTSQYRVRYRTLSPRAQVRRRQLRLFA